MTNVIIDKKRQAFFNRIDMSAIQSAMHETSPFPSSSGPTELPMSKKMVYYSPVSLTGPMQLSLTDLLEGSRIYMEITTNGESFTFDSTSLDIKVFFAAGSGDFSPNVKNIVVMECMSLSGDTGLPVIYAEVWNDDAPANPVTIPNIYSADGVLSGGRNVDMAGNTLNLKNGTLRLEDVQEGDLVVDSLGNVSSRVSQPTQSQGTSPGLGSGEMNFCGSYFTNNNNGTDAFHIKLPYKPGAGGVIGMYRVDVKGHAYNAIASDIILNFAWAGYSYTSTLIRTSAVNMTPGSTIIPTQYVGTDGHVYLKFKPNNIYYTSFRVDSLEVGNGIKLDASNVEIIQSATDL